MVFLFSAAGNIRRFIKAYAEVHIRAIICRFTVKFHSLLITLIHRKQKGIVICHIHAFHYLFSMNIGNSLLRYPVPEIKDICGYVFISIRLSCYFRRCDDLSVGIIRQSNYDVIFFRVIHNSCHIGLRFTYVIRGRGSQIRQPVRIGIRPLPGGCSVLRPDLFYRSGSSFSFPNRSHISRRHIPCHGDRILSRTDSTVIQSLGS